MFLSGLFHVFEVKRDLRSRDRMAYKLSTQMFCPERPLHEIVEWRKNEGPLNRKRVQRHKK